MDEISNCLNCGSAEHSLLWKLPSVAGTSHKIHSLHWNVPDSLQNVEFSIVRCRKCGLVFATPQPSLDELRQYYSRYADGSKLWTESERKFNRSIASTIAKYKKTGRILDVGCGHGLFLYEMQQRGFECFGVEQVPSAEKYICDHFSFSFFNGSIEEFFAENSENFDIISYLNVLEHLKSPKRLLEQSYCCLSKGGLIVIAVPNAQFQLLLGKIRKWFGSSDPYFQREGKHMVAIGPPHHLISFTQRTLQNMVASVGLEIAKMVPAPVIPNIGCPVRTLMKHLVHLSSCAVRIITLGLADFGYSTLCIGRKP